MVLPNDFERASELLEDFGLDLKSFNVDEITKDSFLGGGIRYGNLKKATERYRPNIIGSISKC